jgi:hypothetical protein
MWVGSMTELRALVPVGAGQTAILLGYYVAGDGGGGVFHWAPSDVTPEDGGVVIDDDLHTGRWKRVFDGPVSVRWFGARGDGATPDTQAIQAAIDFVAFSPAPYTGGNTVVVPPGKYLLEAALGTAALVIKKNNVCLIGTGGPPHGAQLNLRGPGSGILVEADGDPPSTSNPLPTAARGTQIKNLSIYGEPSGSPSTKPLDGIVIHAPSVTVVDCYIATIARHGILIESANDPGPNPPLGVTTVEAQGKYVNANGCRVSNVFFESCGDLGANGDPQGGAALYVHGSNANGFVAVGAFAQQCNVGYFAASLDGGTYVGCYSESGNVGFVGAGASGAQTFIGCTSEDSVNASFPGGYALAVGGGICAAKWGAPQRIGQQEGRLTFKRTWLPQPPLDTTPVHFGVTIPGHDGIGSAIDFTRIQAQEPHAAPWGWSIAYEPAATGYPFNVGSWRLFGNQSGIADPAVDPYGSPFGWTDSANPRGPAMFFVSNPLMNTHRHWSFKQEVELQPGANVVHLLGGLVDPAQPVQYLDPGTDFWVNAQSRLTVDIEYGSVAALTSADVRVVGYAFKPETGGRNAAAKIVNSGSAVAVTVVWHFETFVANYDGSPG